MDKGIFMVKPDAEGVLPDAVKGLNELGLTIVQQLQFRFTKELLLDFYTHGEQRSKDTFIDYMCSNMCLFFLVEGDQAIGKCILLRSKIREAHEVEQPRTLVHAADNLDEAEYEINLLLNFINEASTMSSEQEG